MYETAAPEEILSQGDVIDDCPLITIRMWPPDPGRDVLSETWTIRVAVLTQACDLAQAKTTRVVVAPAPINLAESIVDLRELHTIERRTLEHLVGAGKRVCRIQTPWREHLAQHFGVTYTRIALPEPYPTLPAD